MRKLFALLLIFVMLFSFAGCGEEKDVRGDQIDNTSSEASTEAEFSMGAVDGLAYKNEFIGIGCNLDSGWTFYNDEQIKELNNMAADMAGEEYQKAIKNATIIYDMYAVSGNQLDNINVNLEKVNAIQLAALDIAKNFETIASTVVSSIENMGYTNASYEISTVKIGGKNFDCLNVTAEINGVKMYQTSVAKKCNGYLANITVTTFNENTIADIIGTFYLI